MLYRILDDLVFSDRTRYEKGQVLALREVKKEVLDALLVSGAVSEAHTPPLNVLPGWQKKAEVLEAVGVTTISDLVEADAEGLSEKLDITEEALQRVVEDASRWLDIS